MNNCNTTNFTSNSTSNLTYTGDYCSAINYQIYNPPSWNKNNVYIDESLIKAIMKQIDDLKQKEVEFKEPDVPEWTGFLEI